MAPAAAEHCSNQVELEERERQLEQKTSEVAFETSKLVLETETFEKAS